MPALVLQCRFCERQIAVILKAVQPANELFELAMRGALKGIKSHGHDDDLCCTAPACCARAADRQHKLGEFWAS